MVEAIRNLIVSNALSFTCSIASICFSVGTNLRKGSNVLNDRRWMTLTARTGPCVKVPVLISGRHSRLRSEVLPQTYM